MSCRTRLRGGLFMQYAGNQHLTRLKGSLSGGGLWCVLERSSRNETCLRATEKVGAVAEQWLSIEYVR